MEARSIGAALRLALGAAGAADFPFLREVLGWSGPCSGGLVPLDVALGISLILLHVNAFARLLFSLASACVIHRVAQAFDQAGQRQPGLFACILQVNVGLLG